MKFSAIVFVLATAAAFAREEDRGQLRRLDDPFESFPGVQEFSGRVIVRPKQEKDLKKEGKNKEEIKEIRDKAKSEINKKKVKKYEENLDVYVLDTEGEDENNFIGNLMSAEKRELFEYVEPDWVLYPIASCTSDDRLVNQWHHNDDKMQSCDAWGIEEGSTDVVVAICDTGIQTGPDHPDLSDNRLEGYNAVDELWESQGGDVSAVHPHGTMCAGCAAAKGNNDIGVAGTGLGLSYRPMRVSNSSGGGASLSALLHCAMTAIEAGDNVVSVSYSGVTSSSVRSTGTDIKNIGGLLVWAAGNDNNYLNWGNRDDDDVIVVGATTSSDAKSSFSNYGPSVDLVAPGSSVYTTTVNSGYTYVSGTSFSCPLTAGLIALIWSADPNLTPDEVEDILKSGCDDLGATGTDNTFGYGRINSFKSLELVSTDPTPPSPTPAPVNPTPPPGPDCASIGKIKACNRTAGCSWSGSKKNGSCGPN